MTGLILACVLGAAILFGGAVAQRLRVPAPMILLVVGAGLSFVPGLRGVSLEPDIVLLLFLPVLLYWESLNTSLREIRANLRVILLLAVGLVLATAGVIALVGHAFGLDWTTALVLGAVLAPTDATVVAVLARGLPRRAQTILRAESLINDATALSLYSVAVAAVVIGQGVRFGDIALGFGVSLAAGVALGVAVAFVIYGIRRVVTGTAVHNTLSVLSPFLLYLPAELLHVSAVVSVVTGGLVLSQLAPRVVDARTRQQGFDFWRVTTYIVNGALFLLIGLQLRPVIGTLADDGWQRALWLCLVCAVTVTVVRLVWSQLTTWLIRLLDRRPAQRLRRVSFRGRMPIAWSSFRGAVSLAAALALPATVEGGGAFPDREVIVAATFVVVVVTLFGQGLTLPAIVRWARIPPDDGERQELRDAGIASTRAALDRLDAEAASLGTPDEVRDLVRAQFREHLEELEIDEDEGGDGNGDGDAEDGDSTASPSARERHDAESALRLRLIAVKREAVIGMRDRREIDDTVLRRQQARLDIEQLRLSADADED